MQAIDKLTKLEEKLWDDGEGEHPNARSIKCFLEFGEIIDECVLENFKLSLTPDNDIFASWNEKLFTIDVHFRSDNTAKMVFIPKRKETP